MNKKTNADLMKLDLYKILGVARDATDKEVRTNLKSLILYHLCSSGMDTGCNPHTEMWAIIGYWIRFWEQRKSKSSALCTRVS